MPLLKTDSFSPTRFYDFDINMPGSGGVNLKDLEYEMEPNQSPNLLNMMYRNGSFSKRYGQKQWYEFSTGEIDAIGYFNGDVFICTEGAIWQGNPETKDFRESFKDNRITGEATLINFNRRLYYWNENLMFEYNPDASTKWKKVEYYVPDVLINRKPDASYKGDPIDNYNRIGAGFRNTFHGDGTSTTYYLSAKNLDSTTPLVFVDEVQVTDFTFDAKNGKVTFKTAPAKGTNNVKITAYKTNNEYFKSVMKCKYHKPYGGNNNSRLFAGGGGDGMIYYSDVADISYFPDNNNFRVGNDEDDVTGFGEQYDLLMVFKPKEIYSLEYYIDASNNGTFRMKLVNAEIGCDAPKTIQLINNQLTWLSSIVGVCTLVSTAIEDERNVRIISRNIEGGYRIAGLTQEKNLKDTISIDWDNKYLLTINGKVYMWDYLMTPYYNTGNLDSDSKRLAWFIFDNFNVDHYIKTADYLYYTKGSDLIKIVEDFNDFGKPIHAYYQTPYLQFSAVPYLKTVKNIYIQTRADTATVINMTYFTEESPNGEREPEPIRVYDKLWHSFQWNTFGWQFTNIANTFRRKCSLKKIQMVSVLFENDEVDRDISISHLSFQYTLVKNIK